MTVRDTSIESYHGINIGRQQFAIIRGFLLYGGRPTRRELANNLHMETSTVAGRVNELIKLGLVNECPKRKCQITGRTAYTLELA